MRLALERSKARTGTEPMKLAGYAMEKGKGEYRGLDDFRERLKGVEKEMESKGSRIESVGLCVNVKVKS